MTKVAGGRRLLDQIDTVKSVASLSQTIFVLFGTYDLLNLVSLNAQLDRRTSIVHLERYCFDKPNNIDFFAEVLETFQKHLPLNKEPNLVAKINFFYEGSLGCVGMLKTWLTQALAACLLEKEERPYFDYCKQYKVSSKRLINRLSEIREGERRLNDSSVEKENERKLQAMLGLSQPEFLNGPASKDKNVRKKISPGNRNPSRDPVGNPYSETKPEEVES